MKCKILSTLLLLSLLFSSCAAEETFPETDETTSETTETAPETETTTPETTETSPETDETAPETTETAPETEATIPAIKETLSETEATAPETTETAPETDETTPEITETSPETEATTPETTETLPETEETLPPPQLPVDTPEVEDIPGELVFFQSGTTYANFSAEVTEPSRLSIQTREDAIFVVSYKDDGGGYHFLSSSNGKVAYLPPNTYSFDVTCTDDWKLEIYSIGLSATVSLSGSGTTITDRICPTSQYYTVTYSGEDGYIHITEMYGDERIEHEDGFGEFTNGWKDVLEITHPGEECFFIIEELYNLTEHGSWTISPADEDSVGRYLERKEKTEKPSEQSNAPSYGTYSYILNIHTHKIHYWGCSRAPKPTSENYLATNSLAGTDDYTWCQYCK